MIRIKLIQGYSPSVEEETNKWLGSEEAEHYDIQSIETSAYFTTQGPEVCVTIVYSDAPTMQDILDLADDWPRKPSPNPTPVI